jgi:cardiolipin synthase
MKMQDIPNIITMIRLLLIIPLCIALFTDQYKLAFYIFIVAGISDGLDGLLARYFNWQTKLGAMVDPVADKLLMLMTYAMLTWSHVVPVWLFVLVIGRDLIITTGVVLYKYLIEEPYYKARFFSKINTAVQIVFVLLLLFNAAFITLSPYFLNLLMYLVVFTTLISLMDYVIVWGGRACKVWKMKSI